MLERQREGMAEEKYKGGAPTARRHAADTEKLRQGSVSPTEIAPQLGINRAYRILRPHSITTAAGHRESRAGNE
jgi:hypothetical protein